MNMNEYCKKLVSVFTDDLGRGVAKVASSIHMHGSATSAELQKSTNLSSAKVKTAICHLMRHRMVRFRPESADYVLDCRQVILTLRYSKCVILINNMFGAECAMLLDELLRIGYGTASELILCVVKRIKARGQTVTINKMIKNFDTLQAVDYLITLADNTTPHDNHTGRFIDLLNSQQMASVEANQAGIDTLRDRNVYWGVNFERFRKTMKDEVVYKAVLNQFDRNTARFIYLLLKQPVTEVTWASDSEPVSLEQARAMMELGTYSRPLLPFFDDYIQLLEENSLNLVVPANPPGNFVRIRLKKFAEQLATDIIVHIILQKFDKKAVRIFQLVNMNQYIEQEKLEKLTMLPEKESRRLIMILFQEKFLQIEDVDPPHSCSHKNATPRRLLFVDIYQIAMRILEMCYKTLYNIRVRKNHEKLISAGLLTKKKKIDSLVANMTAQNATPQQIFDVQQKFTPQERIMLLDDIDRKIKKLDEAEFELEDDIFLLDFFVN